MSECYLQDVDRLLDRPLIRVENLSFSRGERVIFDQINLRIPEGKITAILGPSGTGKTTFLKMLGRQLKPEKGKIEVFDQDISQLSRKALFEYRKRIGFLFQSGALFSDMSVFDNVAFSLREHTDLSENLIRSLVLLKLEAVGLRGAQTQMPNELSGGQVRRVALARAIALDPQLLIYDEPFAGQDPISMSVLVNLISNLNKSLGLTSIIITHDVKEVLSIADYVYLLSEGKIVEHGSPELIYKSQDTWVCQFINGLKDGPVPYHLPTQPLKEALCLS